MLKWQEKRISELADKLLNNEELTPKERKEWNRLNEIWEEEQEESMFQNWKNSQPI